MTTPPPDPTSPLDPTAPARGAEVHHVTSDPVNRWATEHYGFDDEPLTPAGPATSAAAPPPEPTSPTDRQAHRGVLVAAGVLGLVLGGGGAAAVAAVDAGDGPRGGRDGVFEVQVDTVRGDGMTDQGDGGGFGGVGGRRGGFR